MSLDEFSYEYFSGANISLYFGEYELDAVGVSYQIAYSKQPIYSYFSRKFDAVLDGKHLVQGKFVINFKDPKEIESKDKYFIGEDLSSISKFFDISIDFGNNKKIILKTCFIIGYGQTIQIDDTVILTEYSFAAREIINNNI